MVVQVADEPVPDRLQLVNVPLPVLLIATVPIGAIAVPGEVSVTVTVQTVLPLSFGHVTIVDVVRSVTVRLVVPELP